MGAELLTALVSAIVAGVISGAVTWGIVKTELKYMRRDIDKNATNIVSLEERRRQGEATLHSRITGLTE